MALPALAPATAAQSDPSPSDRSADRALSAGSWPERQAGQPRTGRPGPRIYNLLPQLLGPLPVWPAHLPRIAGMGFDWVFVTLGGQAIDDERLAEFCAEADGQGLKVMVDLAVHRPAAGDGLAGHHRTRSDRFDYDDEVSRQGLIRHFAERVKTLVAGGVQGFRCDAAHEVPAGVWRVLIEAARAVDPDTVFAGETLGTPIERIEELDGAGFDFLFNSARWWDFRADWLIEQYNRLRTVAPSIAFPESAEGQPLAAELADGSPARLEAALRLRYLFAAGFSTGVMIPAGFEYGATGGWPDDPAQAVVDLTHFITAVNRIKAMMPALNIEGPLQRVTPPGDSVVGLLRGDPLSGETALLLINPDEVSAHPVDAGMLIAAADGAGAFHDCTPGRAPVDLRPGAPLLLDPMEIRVFRGLPDSCPLPGDEAAAEARLRDLAEQRVAIEDIRPRIDGGRFAVKRVVGDVLEVSADIFADGHDHIACCLQYRAAGDEDWTEVPLRPLGNDRWGGELPLTRNARYRYRIEAWRDLFASWRADTIKKRDAGLDLSVETVEGERLVAAAAKDGQPQCRDDLRAYVGRLHGLAAEAKLALLLSETLEQVMARGGRRTNCTRSPELEVVADRTRAAFAAWYELFPRSAADDPARHGTFDDVIARLPYVKSMGFDVLYFPPIHPIGRSHRKGRNNSLTPGPDDPGVPYAIGSEEGGHDAIHPELGSFADFERLVRAARALDIEIALDFAIQCSPDHPWIREHPEWFDWRPDGTIKYAENPPKKYQDIVNVHFYRQALPDLWYALRDIVLFWVGRGVRIFRVDNPHTKPFPFWEWMIGEVQRRHPDTIFLSEAFTRPKVMKRLAKLGFTQSYSYFTWRTGKQELTDYLQELTRPPVSEYMRPNFFVNTPDINPPYLHSGDPAMFRVRAVLAATLSSLWGLYSGFELCEGEALPGKEEYLNSEKYEIRARDWDRPGNIRGLIAALNRARRDNPALRSLTGLTFHAAHHDQVLFYAKQTPRRDNLVLAAVALDGGRSTGGVTLELPLQDWGVPEDGAVAVEDLLGGGRWFWYGRWQQVSLTPELPCGLWRVRLPHHD